MAADLILAPEAEDDLAEAYGWYERRRIGLGEDFLECVDACIQRIRRHPGLGKPIHQSYRRALVRRFPYAVFYEYENNTIIVYCIFHTARDPTKWRQRLP
jgi:plasmid stabilization system protein ParE